MLLMLTVVAAATAGEVVIRGTLLGADGKPMPLGEIHIGKQNMRRVAVATSNSDGTYSFTTAERGAVIIEFTGAYHIAKTASLLLTDAAKDIEINARLQANTRPATIDSVIIIGDFNEFDFGTGRAMTKQSDGTFRAEFDESPDNFRYQVLIHGAGNAGELHSVNGTQADSYAYDGGGDYRAVLNAAKGKRVVTFDPSKMPLKSAAATVEIKDEWQKKFSGILEQSSQRTMKVQKMTMAFMAEGGKKGEFRFNAAPMREEFMKDYAAEKDAQLKTLMLMSYMDIPYSATNDERSRELAAQLLGSTPANSPLWYDKRLALEAVNMTGQPEKYAKYISELHNSGDTNTIPWGFIRVMAAAEFFGRKSDVGQMYGLMKKLFSETRAFSSAKRQYDPSKQVEVGHVAPQFAFASVENPNKQITNESIRGKYTLIDLWAVWCGPCRGEMPNLHKAYERFKNKNFEILSVSFDKKADDVTKYRDDKWKMPWMHAFSEGVFESKAADIFEVVGIPKPILVSPDGLILAMESDLRGENLEKTLAKYLEPK